MTAEDLGFTFTFDESQLDGLPTHVGIVWTDGAESSATQVEFFGGNGLSLGVVGPFETGDGNFSGGTNEDRFFGIINESGVKSFTIRTPGSNTISKSIIFSLDSRQSLF